MGVLNTQGNPVDSDCNSNLLIVEKLIEDLYVPKFEKGFERPAAVSDYSDYLISCDKNFDELVSSLDSVILNKSHKSLIPSAIILAGEHSSSNVWTTKETLKLSEIFLSKVLNLFSYPNITDVLTANHSDIFGKVLKQLRPKLLKDSWKNYPAAVVSYSWILYHVENPHLSEHLTSLVPTTLLLVDDFGLDNRVLGLKCLQHIIDQVDKTRLSWYAYDDVISKALEPLVYLKDEVIIEPLIIALMSLMKKIHAQPSNVNLEAILFIQICKFDPMIDRILHNMMLEPRLKIRSAYAKMLPVIIRARGLGMLVHSNALLKVIDEYVLEPSSSFEGLEILNAYVEICWPRMGAHFDQILLLVCKFYLGIQKARYPQLCEPKLMVIVKRIKHLCPEKMEERKNDLSKEKFFSTLQHLFDG